MSAVNASVTIDDIRQAASVIAGHVVRTPAVPAARLAEATGARQVVLKLENLQYTGSFKDRGAYNKLASLNSAARTAGVIAMSAGNHAQGVAYHAQRLGIPSTIVMPEGTPFNKVERTASFGARVLIQGESIDSAAVFARDMAAREGLTFVHPYDDPLIVAGQGTIGLELLADFPDLNMIVVPIGGGGVMSGVAIAAKSINPKIEMIGVEAALYPSMHNAVRNLAPNNGGQTIAEGIAVKSPGKLTQDIISRLVSDLLLVNEDALERAVQMMAERQKVIAEGAGAAGLAALIAHGAKFKDKRVGLVVCGGNVDSRMLAQVLMRGLVREGRVVTLRIGISNSPGVLGKLALLVGQSGGDLIDIHHQRMFDDLPVKRADVDAVIETRNPEHYRDIIASLEKEGFPTRLLSNLSSGEKNDEIAMTAYRNVLETIGKTPLVEVSRLDSGPCRLFLKLENQNPGGSIKDRIALSMIEAAERDGSLKPGGTLIEATAGNTGLGLALVASQKGYPLILVIPDKMAQEKIYHLRALGAEVRMTRSDVGKGHPEYYQDMAERLTRETPGAIYVNQFANPANPLAHETGTGPEIWAQMDHDVDAVVVGVGSGGTLTGIGRFLRRVAPQAKMVLADPNGSVLAPLVKTGKTIEAGSWLVEGIGEDFVPPNCDLSLVSEAFTVSDAESFATARDLLRKEAILAGSSSGTLIAAALKYCRAQTTAKRVVTFVCDSGNKYLSKMFNDYWMLDQGLLARDRKGDLRDLIARRHADRATVTVAPGDSLLIAYQRMKLYEISQLPVLDGGKVAGIIDESDLLLAVYGHPERFRDPVASAMTGKVETVQATDSLTHLIDVFALNHAAMVMDGSEFLGLITRIDLLNHLRRSIA